MPIYGTCKECRSETLEIQKYSPSMATTDCVTMAENLLRECQRREQPEASE